MALLFAGLFFLSLHSSYANSARGERDLDPDLDGQFDRTAYDMQALQKLAGNQSVASLSTSPKMMDIMKNPEAFKRVLRQVISANQSISRTAFQRQLKVTLTKDGTRNKFLLKDPRYLEFLTTFLRDNKALPELANIVQKKKRLWIFVGINIGIFFFGIALKKLSKNDEDGLITKVRKWFVQLCFTLSLRFGVFFYLFFDDVKPTLDIAKQTFF